MGGGLMQLVAYGAQDVYLSGNPQITFFKVVYRRHTNFSVEPIQQTWNGAGDFGRTVTCNINRNGDLITNMYVVVDLNSSVSTNNVSWGFVRRLGHALVSDCKIEIGGSNIDEHYSDWLNVWYELTHKVGQERGYAKMIGDVPELTTLSYAGTRPYRMYIPLIFWFNRNNGLALPLIALQYHDVRVTLIYRDLASCVNYAGSVAPMLTSVMGDNYLLIDYVYLDAEERKRFAQASHEYLIEQLQFTGSESLTQTTNKIRLNFNHPCKYLIWAPHLDRYNTRNAWVSYATDGNWATANDTFAKLLFIATSQNLNITSSAGIYTVTVNPHDSTSAGDLFTPAADAYYATSTNPTIASLLSKIDVKLVRQDNAIPTGDASISTGLTATISTGNSLSGLLQDLLNNSVVVQNNLTMQDISKKLSDLVLLLNPTTGFPAQILSLGQVNIIDYTNYGNFLDGSDNPVYNSKLQLNGHDRFQQRDGYYFNYVQPMQHFSNTPADGINVYSFALKAEDHQPSGSCNFSRIDNATLQVDVGLYNSNNFPTYFQDFIGINSSSLLNIFTVNYNVLRIMSGMGGTAYSN
jgi:hypothetical protein